MRNCSEAGWGVYACSFAACMDIMLPERSFVPVNVRGKLMELSLGSLSVESWEVTEEFRHCLRAERRYAEIDVDLGDGRVLQLRTRIVSLAEAGSRVRLTLDILSLSEDQELQFRTLLDDLVQHRRIADLSQVHGGMNTPALFAGSNHVA